MKVIEPNQCDVFLLPPPDEATVAVAVVLSRSEDRVEGPVDAVGAGVGEDVTVGRGAEAGV